MKRNPTVLMQMISMINDENNLEEQNILDNIPPESIDKREKSASPTHDFNNVRQRLTLPSYRAVGNMSTRRTIKELSQRKNLER